MPRPGSDELLAEVIGPGPRMMNPAPAERAGENGSDKALPGQRAGVAQTMSRYPSPQRFRVDMVASTGCLGGAVEEFQFRKKGLRTLDAF